jgi:hypothetical protein
LVFLDIFYPPNFGRFQENGLFQHPQAIALKTPVGVSERNRDFSPTTAMSRLTRMPAMKNKMNVTTAARREGRYSSAEAHFSKVMLT